MTHLRKIFKFVGLACIACSISGVSFAMASKIKPSTELPGRVDPEIPVREEFDAAIAKNTREAFVLFIKRHPDHRLAREMKDILKARNMAPAD